MIPFNKTMCEALACAFIIAEPGVQMEITDDRRATSLDAKIKFAMKKITAGVQGNRNENTDITKADAKLLMVGVLRKCLAILGEPCPNDTATGSKPSTETE